MPVKTFQEQYIADRAGHQTHVILPVELPTRRAHPVARKL